MSNRRKSAQERINHKTYREKSRRPRAMFPGLAGMDFEFLKTGKRQVSRDGRDRSLNGKDRVRARRGQR